MNTRPSTRRAIAARGVGGFTAQLLTAFIGHYPILLCIFGYVAIGVATAVIFDATDKVSVSIYSATASQLTFLFAVCFFPCHAIYVMIRERPKRLIRYILDDYKNNYLTAERIVTALPILIFIPLFISVFTSLKTMIPLMNAYSWDAAFAQWDAVLHGGYQPWELLQPLFGYPLATFAISFVYQLWFFVSYGVLFWQAFSLHDPLLRMRFFVAFVLTWALLGNLGATLLSSAGPCYFGRVTDIADPYVPLFDYLRSVNETFPVWALAVQDSLWETYRGGGFGLGSGIAAMPSVHVATATLYALVGWRTNRVLGIAFTAFAVVIMIGSVHLGWHYAVDGYLGFAGIAIIWFAVGRVLERLPLYRNS